MEMTGLLLAGGRSLRMGRDKASIEVDGQPLAVRAVNVLRGFCTEILVASGDGRRLAWLGEEQVADAIPDAGPLAGIVAGLERSSHELVAVVAVDMPFASAAVFRLLGSSWQGEDAMVPVTKRGLEPLHALYSRAASVTLRNALENDKGSVVDALRSIRTTEVRAAAWRDADPSGRFATNVNRPEHLADLEPR
jgi:molybdopterin-guanine dinucleotide biosynthesis protein A